MFEKYVSLIDGARPAQVAVESKTENEVSKPRPKLVLPSSKKLSRSAKPAAQASADFEVTKVDEKSSMGSTQ